MKIDKPFIFLVEDNQGDVALLEMMISKLYPDALVEKCYHGDQTLALFQSRESTSANCPNLIILDWNLPAIQGIDILQYLKSSRAYKTVPTIILSSSDYDQDITKAYLSHANGYICKSIDFITYRKDLECMLHYWLKVNHLPNTDYLD